MFVFVLSYFTALLLYQLAFWGNDLNSVERFTRIPLRILHFTGLFVAAVGSLEHLERGLERLSQRVVTIRCFITGVIAMVLIASVFQVWSAYRRIDDLRARTYQGIIPEYAKIREEGPQLREILAGTGFDKSRIRLIDATGQIEHFFQALYHIQPLEFGHGRPAFELENAEWIWRPATAEYINKKRSSSTFEQGLASADIIWPLVLEQIRFNRGHILLRQSS